MELKETLLMPKTDFEMRGNLMNKEPLMIKKWDEMDLYGEVLKNRKDAIEFILHDGPPYANGNMHCGHMLNRILKDFTIRYKNMCGYKTPFVFGWDTHGLPIENQVTKSGINRKTTPIVDFRKKCEEYALKQVENQKQQIHRLGLLGDFNHPYLTLMHEYETNQIALFADMALKGYIFKGLKPVYWSPSSESALAEAEIEYYDVESYSIYVAFNVKDGKNLLPNDAKVIIWTTTPWTLPANLAVSLHPDFVYGLFNTDQGKFVFLNEFKDKLSLELGLTNVTLIKTFKGQEAEGIVLKHPFYDRDSILIVGEHVTNDAGTGCVHTAPGHGEDDYIVCKKYGIKPFCPVDSRGYLTSEAGNELSGLFYGEANEKVLEILKRNNALLKCSKFTHSYPHDWRTKKPLIFRATPQWFCSISPIREELLKQVNNVKWYPSWGKTRMENMIKDRDDWCISRQRAWGVPLPIIYNEDGSPIIDKEVFTHIADLFRQYGSNIWFSREAKELLPEGYHNKLSPHDDFKKEQDIMDVWFDSGSSFAGVLLERGLNYPADLYLEGNDQYRGWFNSSLILSTATHGHAPFKNVVTHGFVVDENWQKMSKSAGNGIDPSKVANQFGADILRLWVASVDYQQDVRISESIIAQVSEVYRKIRNTFKFMLGNLTLGDGLYFNPKADMQASFELVDTFILAELERVKNEVIKDMDNYDFMKAMSEMMNFISFDLSSFYLDITKDILYCENKASLRRKQVQTVIYTCLDTLMRLWAPILSFTMEEVYSNLHIEDKKQSVHLLDYPKASHNYNKEVLTSYAQFKHVRDIALLSLEKARRDNVIGSSQEANLVINIKEENIYQQLKKLEQNELARLFIVSHVKLSLSKEESALASKSNGHKCPRCWNYVETLYNVEGNDVCPRCKEAIKHE